MADLATSLHDQEDAAEAYAARCREAAQTVVTSGLVQELIAEHGIEGLEDLLVSISKTIAGELDVITTEGLNEGHKLGKAAVSE